MFSPIFLSDHFDDYLDFVDQVVIVDQIMSYDGYKSLLVFYRKERGYVLLQKKEKQNEFLEVHLKGEEDEYLLTNHDKLGMRDLVRKANTSKKLCGTDDNREIQEKLKTVLATF